jgi:hypothetical protein
MREQNITWERIQDGNGTAYCCWLYNVHFCENSEEFQNLCLGAGILGIIVCVASSLPLAYFFNEKTKTGRKSLFLLPLSIFYLCTLTISIHLFFLFGNVYGNSPYGAIGILIAADVGTLGIIAYTLFLLSTCAEIIGFDERKLLIYKKIYYGMVVFFMVFANMFVIATFYEISNNLARGEALFESVMIILGALHFGNILPFTALLLLFRKKVQEINATLSVQAKWQVKMTQGFSISLIFAVLGLVFAFFLLALENNIFKIIPLSKFEFVIIHYGLILFFCLLGAFIFIGEFEKKRHAAVMKEYTTESNSQTVNATNFDN